MGQAVACGSQQPPENEGKPALVKVSKVAPAPPESAPAGGVVHPRSGTYVGRTTMYETKEDTFWRTCTLVFTPQSAVHPHAGGTIAGSGESFWHDQLISFVIVGSYVGKGTSGTLVKQYMGDDHQYTNVVEYTFSFDAEGRLELQSAYAGGLLHKYREPPRMVPTTHVFRGTAFRGAADRPHTTATSAAASASAVVVRHSVSEPSTEAHHDDEQAAVTMPEQPPPPPPRASSATRSAEVVALLGGDEAKHAEQTHRALLEAGEIVTLLLSPTQRTEKQAILFVQASATAAGELDLCCRDVDAPLGTAFEQFPLRELSDARILASTHALVGTGTLDTFALSFHNHRELRVTMESSGKMRRWLLALADVSAGLLEA